jgi:hypothetical protein
MIYWISNLEILVNGIKVYHLIIGLLDNAIQICEILITLKGEVRSSEVLE